MSGGMLLDPAFLLAALAAILVAGVSKGGFASGAAFAATPILALAAPPQVALAVMLPVLLVMDFYGVWSYRGQWDWPNARALLLSALIGVAVGTLVFDLISEDALKLALGLTALFFVAWRALRASDVAPARPAAWRALVFGALAGFSSTIAHAGGPLVNMHLLPQKLAKTTFQATAVFFFWGINVVKIVPYAALGLFTRETLLAALALAPLALLGMRLGVWAHRRVSEALFYRVVYVFVAVVGAKLVYDGLSGLL